MGNHRALTSAGVAAGVALLALSIPAGCSQSGTIVFLQDAGFLPDVGYVIEPDAHPVVSVTMNANDPAGTGANTLETYLNLTNVNDDEFGKLYTRTVDGDQFAQPLYVGGLRMPDGNTRDVVFVATEHDSVYAFDAGDVDDVSGDYALWKVSLGTSTLVPGPFLEAERCGAKPCCKAMNLRESGITATPAIDLATSTMYVVALDVDSTRTTETSQCIDVKQCTYYTCEAPTFTYRLHALDLATGTEKYGGPVEIKGSVDGSGGRSVHGKITFDAGLELVRPGLLIANHNVYVSAGSYGDLGEYHGWVFAFDETSLRQAGVWNDTRDGEFGGIWQSGRGPISDGSGSIYVVTGNGSFNANHGGHDYGDSVVKLSADLKEVEDYWSPQLSDYEGTNYLEKWDGDLGSAGATLIPGTTLLLASGKMGIGVLLDTHHLGEWTSNGDRGDNTVQRMRITWRPTTVACDVERHWAWIYGTPVVWQGHEGMHVYVWADQDNLRDYLLDGNGKFIDSGHLCFCDHWVFEGANLDVDDPNCASVHSEGIVTGGHDSAGAALSVSSNGMEDGTGILWVTRAVSGAAIHYASPGVLEAYDASDVHRPVWSSATNAKRDGLGDWAKFAPPTIANGKVFTPTFSNQLVVYGLLHK
jgi:hypothetical protein